MDAARVAALLDSFEGVANAERRWQLDQIRRQADLLCVGRFERTMVAAIAETSGIATLGGGDSESLALDGAVRALRRLETAGRRLGSGDDYDAMLGAFSAGVEAAASGFTLADRVRLVEILCRPGRGARAALLVRVLMAQR